MLTAKISFICETLSIDRETNQVSAFNIIDSFAAPAFPMFLRQVSFYCVLERAAGDPYDLNLIFSAEINGQQVFSNPQPVAFGNELIARGYARINGFLIPGPGKLAFKLTNGNATIAEYNIIVTAISPPSGQMALVGVAPTVMLTNTTP